LRGKCALITGSTAGLGFAIADRLAAEGCRVIINGLATEQDGERARDALSRKHGVEVRFHGADLSVPERVAELIQFARDTFGGVDILVNNAVVRHFSPVEDFPVERWNEALAVNLSAAFHTIRLALPGMRQRGWGRIINVASVYSFVAAENRIDYVTTKTAILGMTRVVALETAKSEITCNAIAPGVMATPAILARFERMAKEQGVSTEQATRDYIAKKQPTGKYVPMENVAALVAFLCGTQSQGITGAVFPLDGGWTIS
jgi:3-hydroxybutyrate dehydrogenase